MSDSLCMGTLHVRSAGAILALIFGVAACGSLNDPRRLFEPGLGTADPRPAAYLNFPAGTYQAPRLDDESQPDFPRLLSQTGAFRNTAELEPAPGLVPYDLQAPLWSDGAYKQRWMSLPALGVIQVFDDAPWQVPEGTVFVKHFEMSLDESQPEVRRRLETRLLVAARGGTFYGVTYKWNADESDAEIVLDAELEPLSIRGADGVDREQPYFYPGPRDCNSCHGANSGYVLGLRTRQLNRDHEYRSDFPAINQLVAWSGWGFLDHDFDNTDTMFAPRLADPTDESEPLEQRVRAYWDGNCAMCHAGKDGSVMGWDARILTPTEQQGLDRPPRSGNPSLPSMLIDPGNPDTSYIYVRGDTAEAPLRMPPIGRNRIDAAYVDVLEQWIESLAE
ncbi:MAG: hypothetical protein ABI895_02375 [Deltaproteobacteria bacterium]